MNHTRLHPPPSTGPSILDYAARLTGWLAINTVLGIMNALLITFYSAEPLTRVFAAAQLNTHTICIIVEIAIYVGGIRIYEYGRRAGRPIIAFVLVLLLAVLAAFAGVYAGAHLTELLLDFDPLQYETFFSVIYGSILAAIVVTAVDRWGRHLARRRLELESAYHEARLKSLQYRMRPHFLFNALNTIHATLRRDPEGAGRALFMLAENYRFILETADNTLIDFAEEWEFTRNYIELERLRFADRLTVQLEQLPDAEAFQGIRLPPLTIQPLIENACVHGIRNLREDARITLRAERRGTQITVEVQDNGPGFQNPAEEETGGTFAHIRQRLEFHFPGVELYRRNLSEGEKTGAVAGFRFDVPPAPAENASVAARTVS